MFKSIKTKFINHKAAKMSILTLKTVRMRTAVLTFAGGSWAAAACGNRRRGGRRGGPAAPRGTASCPASPAPTAAPRSPTRPTWWCTGGPSTTPAPST